MVGFVEAFSKTKILLSKIFPPAGGSAVTSLRLRLFARDAQSFHQARDRDLVQDRVLVLTALIMVM
jgi:hypothetical protein